MPSQHAHFGRGHFDAADPPFGHAQPLVLKLGGSLIRQRALLLGVLDSLARARRPLAVVTGGGAFADQVRSAQAAIGFDACTAHRMAILSLHQTALLAASFAPTLRLCECIEEIGDVLAAGGKALYLPLRACLDDELLPATWDATSDAIATRLAERLGPFLGPVPLVLVKSRKPMCRDNDPASLAADDLIDPVCASRLTHTGLPFTIVTPGEAALLAQLLLAGETVDAA